VDLFLITVVGGIAWRGANTLLFYEDTSTAVLYFPMWSRTSAGRYFLRAYVFGAIPIALLNGYILYGFGGLVICGVGTWLLMLLSNLILRFSPANQLYGFGLANIIWTLVNLSQL
jgi:hypothetical protein